MTYPAGTTIRRMVDYPYLMLVPLAPLIVQQRAARVECSGFGDRCVNGYGL